MADKLDQFIIETNNNAPFYKRRLFWIISFSIIILITVIIIIIVVTTNSNEKESINNQNPQKEKLNNMNNDNNNDNNNYFTQYIPYICLDENKIPSNKCIGGWFYHTEEYTPEYNAKFAKSKNWNYVLLSANIKNKNIINNINEFRKQDISVHFMTLQDTSYLDNPEKVYDKIKDILLFVKENNLDIQGIHIDCEPHAKQEWKDGDSEVRTKIFQNYTKILENCRKAINDYNFNIAFSAAVGWFYSSKTKKGEIIGGRGYELVNKDRLDFIIPMVYDGAGGTIRNIIKHTDDYINDNANTVIGLAVRDYNENLDDMIEQVFENRENSNYFYGVAIYSNHYYSDWGEEIN